MNIPSDSQHLFYNRNTFSITEATGHRCHQPSLNMCKMLYKHTTKTFTVKQIYQEFIFRCVTRHALPECHLPSCRQIENICKLQLDSVVFYKHYHKKYWCFKKSYKRYKFLDETLTLSGVGLVVIGTITGGITLNPIIKRLNCLKLHLQHMKKYWLNYVQLCVVMTLTKKSLLIT